MNVLRVALSAAVCGLTMTAHAAPTMSLEHAGGALANVAGGLVDGTAVDRASLVEATAVVRAAPAATDASKADAFAPPIGPKAVPEPGSLALLGIAGAALVAARGRRARRA